MAQIEEKNVKKPELLLKSKKKFIVLELEMDRFLAKKQQIFSSKNDLSKISIMTNIIHLTLKSTYELIRMYQFNTFGY